MHSRVDHIAMEAVRPPSRFLRPRAMQMVSDLIAFTVGFVVYQWLRSVLLPNDTRDFSISDHLLAGGIVTVFWMLMFWFGGLYKDYYVRSPFEEFFTVIRYTFIGSALFFLLIYFSSGQAYQQNPRFVFALYWVLVCGFALIGRFSARSLQRSMRERGMIKIPAVLVGTADRLAELISDLHREKAWGYAVAGIVLVQRDDEASTSRLTAPVLGSVDTLPEILDTVRPSEVLITMEHSDHTELLKIVAQGADSGARVRIVPDMYEIVSGQARTLQIYGAPLIDVNPELMQPWEEFAKRALDIFVSVVVLALGLPVWLLIAAIVKMTSAGPIFFKQPRVGRHGQVFNMVKFRSMVTDTGRGPTWTDKNDPRVTPIGRFIRKTHLDEIPQLWNVLVGEMSLVGPRPEQPFYVDKFTAMLPYYRRRHKVRPGITGWWQVKAKSNPESLQEIETRLRYDFFYIENISFKLDVEILVRTIFVMLQGHGRA